MLATLHHLDSRGYCFVLIDLRLGNKLSKAALHHAGMSTPLGSKSPAQNGHVDFSLCSATVFILSWRRHCLERCWS